MVVIDDFRKQILYQRLNLGYDCTFCSKRFYSKREQLQHLRETHLNPRKKENLECPKCGKLFGHRQIYQLHQQIHALSEPPSINLTSCKLDGNQNVDSTTTKSQQSAQVSRTKEKQKQKSSNSNAITAAKKSVGLTKIRMEDCMRCDACSCIYIDRNDYYKHMRNFHKVNISDVPIPSTTPPSVGRSVSLPKPVSASVPSFDSPIPVVTPSTPVTVSPNKSVISSKTKCRSCRAQCPGYHITGQSRHQHKFHHVSGSLKRTASNELFKFSMQDNIKDRWSKMVSQRLVESEEQCLQVQMKIKPDPDAMETESSFENNNNNHNFIDSDEMSHLLSQVEVKIKMEPPD